MVHASIFGIPALNLSCITLFHSFHVILTENFPRINTPDSEMSHGDGSLRDMGLLSDDSFNFIKIYLDNAIPHLSSKEITMPVWWGCDVHNFFSNVAWFPPTFKMPWTTFNSFIFRLSRILGEHSAVSLSRAWSFLTVTQIEAQMEGKINNFHCRTDRQENGEMQEGEDLSRWVCSKVMCCLSLLYHLT